MAKKIALQLYSIREVPLDYENKVRQVAAMGFPGVETAGFPGYSAEKAARLFEELGLQVAGAHVGLPLGEKKQEILDALAALGKPTLVCTQIGREDVKSMDTVKALCDGLNKGYAVARENGLTFAIHNHWWEFGQLDGRLIHDLMVELLDPGILFEIDTYWAQVGGCNPADVVRQLGKRVPMLHIKDGPGVKDEPHTAVGEGVMNVPAILRAAQPDAWQIVELDRCATDPMMASKKSYDYLASL
jgi:sugar phosphate isomerase/epimerase